MEMIVLGIITLLVFAFMWYSANRAMKLGRDQKGNEMLLWIRIFIFLAVVFTLLNLVHLFV